MPITTDTYISLCKMVMKLISWMITFMLTVGACSVQAQSDIMVTSTGGYSCSLEFKNRTFQCSLGRNGVTNDKVEGDGCTPQGIFPLRRAFYRKDRLHSEPSTVLELNITLPTYGWCDDVNSEDYNQFVYLPTNASHEELWLSTSYYDLMAVIGYNDDPPIPGKGSAIFFHVTPDYGSTSGCVAMALQDLEWVLANVEEGTQMQISS
jgi:L,D-peptidoglycan transpeptidase YkuD (ErfK/YbiS/YcfS/YnhG family)